MNKQFFLSVVVGVMLGVSMVAAAYMGDGSRPNIASVKRQVAECVRQGGAQVACEAWVRSLPAWDVE